VPAALPPCLPLRQPWPCACARAARLRAGRSPARRASPGGAAEARASQGQSPTADDAAADAGRMPCCPPAARSGPARRPGGEARLSRLTQLQRLTRTMETVSELLGLPSELLGLPSELLGAVLSKIAQPQTVGSLLKTCKDVHTAGLALHQHYDYGDRPDAPMVVQVLSISEVLTEARRAPYIDRG
jgi:hypothetical protein